MLLKTEVQATLNQHKLRPPRIAAAVGGIRFGREVHAAPSTIRDTWGPGRSWLSFSVYWSMRPKRGSGNRNTTCWVGVSLFGPPRPR